MKRIANVVNPGARASRAASRQRLIPRTVQSASFSGIVEEPASDFPRLIATYDALAPSSRFEIVGLSIDKDVDLVRRFVTSRAIRWPHTALGVTTVNPLTQLYNVNSTPSTVLIGADGKVVALNLTGEALRKKLEELTSTKQ